MKRRDILKLLAAAGYRIEEGGNHTKVFKGTRYVSAVPRHNEVGDLTVKLIEKQTGVKLK